MYCILICNCCLWKFLTYSQAFPIIHKNRTTRIRDSLSKLIHRFIQFVFIFFLAHHSIQKSQSVGFLGDYNRYHYDGVVDSITVL